MLPKKRAPTHPGEILADTLEDAEMTQVQLAQRTELSVQTINTLIRGKRGMTATVAIKLAKVFETSPEMWMNLQTSRDLWLAQQEIAKAHHR